MKAANLLFGSLITKPKPNSELHRGGQKLYNYIISDHEKIKVIFGSS